MEAALQGASDILAEEISDQADLRKQLRELAQEIFQMDRASLSAVGQVRSAKAYRALVLEA